MKEGRELSPGVCKAVFRPQGVSAPPALEFLSVWEVHSIPDPLRDALSSIKVLLTRGSCGFGGH